MNERALVLDDVTTTDLRKLAVACAVRLFDLEH